jgi:hypothetical protein
MAYVKTFAIFESEYTKIDEAAEVAGQFNIKGVKPELKKIVTDKIKSLSAEEKTKMAEEMGKLASKLELTVDDLADHNKVAMALLNAGMVVENFSYDGDMEELMENINEGVFDGLKAWWDKAKMKVSKWAVRIGAGSLVGGLITACIGAGYMPEPNYSGDPVTPNAAVIAGGAAFAIGLATLVLGLKGTGDLADVAKAAAASRR